MKYTIATIGSLVLAITTVGTVGYAQTALDEIRIVLQTQPDNLDPCQASKSHVGKVIKQNVVETLTEIDPSDGSIAPRLAVEWNQIDDLTWQFILREGVYFHDGTVLDATAVKSSIERTLDERLDCEIRAKYFGGLELDISLSGPLEIEVRSNVPVPILPTLMGTVTISAVATPADEMTRAPIGTGPYKYSSWNSGTEIVLDRFDNYWGDTPKISKATYIWRSESAVRAAMVASGEADIAPNIALQDATIPEMDFSFLNSETSRLRIDAGVPPLDDVRVRKAINLATDRMGILGTIVSENAIPATQLISPGINGYNPNLEIWEYDVEEAKLLLDEASADGVPIEEEIVLIGRYNLFPNSDEFIQALLAMYQQIGLNVRIQMMEASEWFDVLLKPYAEDRPPNLFASQHDNNNGDAVFTIYAKYHTDGSQSTISDPILDDLIDRAGVATGELRRELYQEAFRRVYEEDIADVPLFHMVGFTRVNPRLVFTPSIATNTELQIAQIQLK